MRLATLATIALAAGCAPDSPTILSAAAAHHPADLQSLALAVHNRERAVARVPALAWDHALARDAAAFARLLAAGGALRHSPRAARHGQGENLWIGTRGAFRPEQMMDSWALEKASFRPGVFPAVGVTGRWHVVGHYTQMIWPETSRLGCAIASAAGADVLVCRYAPAGNVDGRRVP